MCPTRYRDILNPPTNTLPLFHPHPIHPSHFLHFPLLILSPPLLSPYTPLPIINHPPPHLIILNAALINARSLRNKIPSVISLMTDLDFNILHHRNLAISYHIAALYTPPYCFIHNPRDSPHPGGGTGIIYKSSLTISNISYHSFSHSESLNCAISSPFSRTFNTTLFYRPPSPSIDPFLHTISPNTIILGDFNFTNPPSILSLNNLLTSSNLIQHVTSPTHVQGNILDLIISPKTNKIITNLIIGPPFSDHFIILLNLSHPKPTRPLTTRTSRKIHNLTFPDFIADISSLPTITYAELHQSLSTTLDKYVPLVTRTTITHPDSSWYTSSLLKQKRILRTAEKHYLKHTSPTLLTSYNNLKKIYHKAITTAKATHITLKFNKLSNDSKSIHRLSAQLLGRSLKAPLPTTTPNNYHSS